MTMEIADPSFLMIFLLEACNFQCRHCVLEDEPMAPGYQLTFGQLRSCLADCRTLGSIRRVHFSGGETTLWREGERDLVDLLVEIARAGFTPGFISNGSSFQDYDQCLDFFRRYAEGASLPLRFYLSIDTFHENFDPQTGRAPSLDNVLRCKGELPGNGGDLMGEPRVIAVVSKDAASLLPDAMVDSYRAQGVHVDFAPLRYMGKARSLRGLCPDLDSDDPGELGAYGRYAPARRDKPRRGAPGTTVADYPILVGDDYYVHLSIGEGHGEREWRKVAKLGQLPKALLRAYDGER